MRFCILANFMDKSSLLKKINERNRGTLMQTLKIQFTDVGDDFLIARMPVTAAVHQPDGVLHGGATAALAETVGSSAAAVFCNQEDHMLRGINISAKHERCTTGYVYAKATPLHKGKQCKYGQLKSLTINMIGVIMFIDDTCTSPQKITHLTQLSFLEKLKSTLRECPVVLKPNETRLTAFRITTNHPN